MFCKYLSIKSESSCTNFKQSGFFKNDEKSRALEMIKLSKKTVTLTELAHKNKTSKEIW